MSKTTTTFEFRYYVTTDGEVRVELEGLEVMKLQLNSANLSKAIQDKHYARLSQRLFLHVSTKNSVKEFTAE
jgi:hypothetical protein